MSDVSGPWWAKGGGHSVVPVAGQGVEWETSRPARAAEFGSDVVVPAMQAGITGGLLGACLVFVAGALFPDLVVNVFKLWMGLSAGVAAAAWLLLLGQHRRLLWAVERVIGSDLDKDSHVGKPRERLVLVGAGQAAEDAIREGQTLQGQARRSQFRAFVAGLDARGTSQRAWVGAGGLTLEDYQSFRDTLIRLKFASWKSVRRDGVPNERIGWALTIPAAWVLERISD